MAQNGILRVVSGGELDEQARQAAMNVAPALEPTLQDGQLIAHIRERFEIMRNHRESSGLGERLLRAIRMFNGEYDRAQLAAIQQFGGSEVFSRIVSAKARGATALLRDIYFAAERPWGLDPTPDPTLPENIASTIPQLVMMEAQQSQMMGQPVDPQMMRQRQDMLMEAARLATVEKAAKEAKLAEGRVDDILTEGGFYKALGEILVDLPIFPFVVLKGPVVRMAQTISYKGGVPQIVERPKMFWKRVSPFDFFYAPGTSDIFNSDVCERLRWTRKDVNDLLGLPGWNEDAIRGVLRDYDQGLRDFMTGIDSTRAIEEDREDPTWNRTGVIDALEYHGNVQGRCLLEIGFSAAEVPDPDLDYFVQAWVCGRYILKAQINPSPRKRHPFFVTSFDKVPGTVVGHALPDMLSDISDVANAALRNLVNNMGMASGPQVVINENRLGETETAQQIYPWKRWMMQEDVLAGAQSRPPVEFFQPQSNAQELLQIYSAMTQIADEISAIPRYATGSGATGGAGRTASGLSMLMGNASKMLQQVAHNVDTDIFYETLTALYDLLMIADGGVNLRGDENIVVRGVTKVLAKETERARQLEFLQLTGNPIDLQIMGIEGRAKLLRQIAKDLGLDEGSPVPTKEQLMQNAMGAAAFQAAGTPPQAAGGAPGNGDQAPAPDDQAGDDREITNVVQPGHNTGGLKPQQPQPQQGNPSNGKAPVPQ